MAGSSLSKPVVNLIDREQALALRKGFRLRWEPHLACHVLLYPEGMIKLNDSAGLIGALIDGQRSVAAIIEQLQRQFPDAAEVGDDIEQFMEVARGEHWITLA